MKTQKESYAEEDKLAIFKVAGGSSSSRVATAIVKTIEEGKYVSLLAVGAGAVNQAVKALCIARGMIAASGQDMYVVPGFKNEVVKGVSKTAINLRIKVQ